MTLSPDSLELTAYVLGELDPAARAAVEAAVSKSPELAAEVAALQQTIGSLSAAFAAEPVIGLGPEQYATVVRAIAGEMDEAPSPGAAGSFSEPSDSGRPRRVPGSSPRKSESPWSRWLALLLGWRGGVLLGGGLA